MPIVYNRDGKITTTADVSFGEWRKTEPFVGTDGIYVPLRDYIYEGTAEEYRLFMSKEIFQEAFKEYILKEGLIDVQSKEHKDK